MSFLLETSFFDAANLPFEETLFHSANGYLGVRANFEEGDNEISTGIRGCYINAFYDTHPINHPEKLHGFPELGEKIVNVSDVQTIRIRADGENLSLNASNIEEYKRSLDMREGVSQRLFIWRSRTGKRIRVEAKRFCSFAHPEVFYIQYTITALDPVELEIESLIQGDVSNYYNPSDPRVSGVAFKALEVLETSHSENRLRMESRTLSTAFRLWVQVDHEIKSDIKKISDPSPGRSSVDTGLRWRATAQTGNSMTIEKRAIYCDSLRHPGGWKQVETIAESLDGKKFADLATEQKLYLDSFWNDAGIEIDGDPHILKGLRYNLYNLLQSAARDPISNIPAKGLSGEGYEGHYFWDTEIYMLPFFLYTRPQIARNLLMYRHTILPGARRHARVLGHKKGAAYPWRTIAGRECSAYYPSGSAQYHINADIAYAVWRYWEATDDIDFILRYGAEILFETARIWIDIGNYSGGAFHINTVTGPDEYTCLVNDNYYTNRMAQNNLEKACEIYTLMKEAYSEELADLSEKITLESNEPELWMKAGTAMTLLYDEKLDINPQDSGFLQKPFWDFAGTPKDKHPLLLNFHHMTLSRHQVCKQADTLLAYILLDHGSQSSTIRNGYRYYEKITTHDSSLSHAAFAILAAQLDDSEAAYRYFEQTAAVDLDNSHGNTKDGIHAANMGGIWLATVWGFGGFEPKGKVAAFNPSLPSRWKSLSYKVKYRGSTIQVRIEKSSTTLTLSNGTPIDVELYGKAYRLESEIREISTSDSVRNIIK